MSEPNLIQAIETGVSNKSNFLLDLIHSPHFDSSTFSDSTKVKNEPGMEDFKMEPGDDMGSSCSVSLVRSVM